MKKNTTQKELNLTILKKQIVSLIAFLFFMVGAVQAQFVHPGITHKKSDLDRMKYMVEAQIDPWYTSYLNMENDSKSSFSYEVQGNASFTELGRDSGVNYGAWNSDIRAAYYNAIRWYVTGNDLHAKKAIEIFKAWSNLTSVTSGGTDSLSGGVGYIMIEAAEIIKSTYSGWLPADLQAFKDMLVYPGYSTTSAPTGNATFYWKSYQGDPVRHGNQGLSGFRTVMAMGIFLDNDTMYKRALRYIQGDLNLHTGDLPYPAGPNTSSASPTAVGDYADTYGITRGYTEANYGYNELMTNYIYENGQCQESSRDQQHTAFGIGLLTSMAEMAWNQGENLYAIANDRLLLGLEYNMRYNVSFVQSYPDQTTPWEPTVASNEFVEGFDRTGRWYSKAVSPVGRGDFSGVRNVFEMPVAHFVGRGFKTETEVKWTQRARDKAIEIGGYEKAGWSNDAIGWGGLTARRPAFCYGDPISGFDSNSLPIYAMNVVPNVIEAENFDYDPINAGEGRIYHDLTSSNTGGAYRTMDNVDLEVTTGGFNLTSIESGEWLTYTVAVPETAVYNISIKYAASQAGGTIKFSAEGEDKTTDLAVPFGTPNSTGDTDWKDYVISSDVILNKGVQSLKLTFGGVSGAFKLDNFTFVQTGIVKQDQSIKFFTIPVKLVSSPDFDPEATASSGLPVSYSSSDTSVATIVSGKVHIVGTGTTTITAMQAGDAYYNAAPNATQELRVVSAVTGTSTLSVIADSYVRDAGNAGNNYGSDGVIVTVASGRYGYLKFDLSSVPGPIMSAKLRIYQRTGFRFLRSIYDVADDNWTETEIKYNNKPSFENERARITTNPAWNEWDISSYTAQEYNNDKIMSVVVKDPEDPTASEKGIDFYSKEFVDSNTFVTYIPELVIEYSSAPLSVASEAVKIKMYPNPVQNDLYISLDSANLNLKDAEINLYTLNGQKVMHTKLDANEVKLDVSKLSRGVYVLTINDSNKSITRKIVKL
ncbi:DNRLRE domain-containing protein [Mariniflexile sp. AS56]|uniref:CBM96 family carbohydrate-binding protein n=1 Tax=Mariniflexile sp. AS56 TaxID=3063957 RepID=UPI0026EB535D|nr:DNRLRE domain-containing protein [Mariniflexile sp. AS56]MDO7171622.1 DNRLRE domain-containing protein [Mariniflexile sp. AS56]